MEYRILNAEGQLQIVAKQRLEFEAQHENVTLSIEILKAQVEADPTLVGEGFDNSLAGLERQLASLEVAVGVLDEKLPDGNVLPIADPAPAEDAE